MTGPAIAWNSKSDVRLMGVISPDLAAYRMLLFRHG